MLISKAAQQAYIDRQFNSYLWMKKLSERDLLAELTQFKVKPQFKTKPWLHQLVCFYIGLCEPRFLFLLDMGAGKTKILLDLMTQLQREKRLDRALVTVPRLINIGSWEEDVLLHSDLEPNLCHVEDVEGKFDQLMTGSGEVSIIDYQGLTLAVCDRKNGKLRKNDRKIRHLQKRFNFLGVDESHKLKNHEGLWFSVLNSLSKEAKYSYLTTGTLFGREPEDLWAQFYIADRGETFGQNLGLFRATFYDEKPGKWKRTELTFRKDRVPLLNQMIQNRSIRYNEREFSDVPLARFIPINLSFSDEQREHYLLALDGLISAHGDVRKTDSAWMKMRQICSGYVSWKDEHGKHTVRIKNNPKLEALERLLDESGEEKMVIVATYRETIEMISERLTALKIKHVTLYGKTKDPLGVRRQFMDDPGTRVFLMNDESGGTGLDGLQKVSRYMVLYETPTSPIPRKQVLKRIHRPGQKERTFFYDLVMRGSVDAGILEDLKNDIDTYHSVIDGATLGSRLKKLFADA